MLVSRRRGRIPDDVRKYDASNERNYCKRICAGLFAMKKQRTKLTEYSALSPSEYRYANPETGYCGPCADARNSLHATESQRMPEASANIRWQQPFD
jgi:hypothetical protein